MVLRKRSRIQEVAEHAGVSIATVSNALNGRTAKMSAETLARVETAIAELDFRPNRAARQLKTGHTPMSSARRAIPEVARGPRI